eukprot:scaffold34929_cov160-Amphora_coffeaeformis.AAC.1
MPRPLMTSLSSMFAANQQQQRQQQHPDDAASVYSSTSSTHYYYTSPETSMEVTAEQHRRLLQQSSASSTCSSHASSTTKSNKGRGVGLGRRGLGLLAGRRQQQQQQQPQQQQPRATSTDNNDLSRAMADLTRQQQQQQHQQQLPQRNNSSNDTTAAQVMMMMTMDQRDTITVTSQSGVRSVSTHQTFSSHDTVKRSNKQTQQTTDATTASNTKSATKSTTKTDNNNNNNHNNSTTPDIKNNKLLSGWKQNLKKAASNLMPMSRGRSHSEEPATSSMTGGIMMLNAESRSRSYGTAATATTTTEDYLAEDELKRLDGVVDVLSLGTARMQGRSKNTAATITTLRGYNNNNDTTDWMASCTGQEDDDGAVFDAARAVQQMLRRTTSTFTSDNDAVMIVLEGFYDQWSVRVEQQQTHHHQQQQQQDDNNSQQLQRFPSYPPPPPPTITTTATPLRHPPAPPPPPPPPPPEIRTKADGSPDMPTHKLWNTLWGSEPAPASTLPTLHEMAVSYNNNSGDGDNPNADHVADDALLMDLVAQSSVPIDVDEDTFIVSTAAHVQAIQDIAAVPLQAGRFAAANRIFAKMMAGIVDATTAMEPLVWHTIRAITYHNMGLLHLWQSQYMDAVECFHQAVETRCSCHGGLRNNTAAMVISLVRQGQAYFALKRNTAALACFQQALEESALTDHQEVVRAKILVNMGVAQYCSGDLAAALTSLTAALTIQRKWLEGPVRRESLVYDAATTLQNMGRLYLERGDATDMACLVYEEALLLLKTVFPKHHPVVLSSYENLAVCHAQSPNQEGKLKAIKILEKCRRCRVEMEGSSAVSTIQTCGWMAHLCVATGRFFQAQTLYQAVYAWQKVWLPANHPAKLHIRKCLAHVASVLQRQQQQQQLSQGVALYSPDDSKKNWI